jgi:hypothetical protein
VARDLIPIVTGVINAATAQGAGVTITPANGAYINAAGMTDQLVLLVDQTYAGSKNLTLKAGVNPPGFRSGIGDTVLALTQAKWWLFIESARYVQADGTINIDCETGMTGTIFCVRVPPETL